MIRMLGVLCGAAIAIGLLTWLVGVPQFTQERTSLPEPIARVELPGTGETAVATVDETAAATTAETASDSSPERAASAVTLEPVGEDAATVDLAPVPAARPNVDLADTPAVEEAEFAPFAPDTTPALPVEIEEESKWFAFWSPFRSELAANGFVARLQSVTGLDYRVVRIKPGVYEVAFAYTDDDEIDAKLATISSATGLQLAGTP